MVGQYFLERRFSRGVGQRRPDKVTGTGTDAVPAVDLPPAGNDVGGKG
jgi:polar amino acid transport system permease protein